MFSVSNNYVITLIYDETFGKVYKITYFQGSVPIGSYIDLISKTTVNTYNNFLMLERIA
jgi:hypothetical protein